MFDGIESKYSKQLHSMAQLNFVDYFHVVLIHHSMFGNNCRYLLSRTDRTRRGFLLALSKIDPALQVSADTARKPDSHKGTNKDMYQNG